MSNRKKLCSLNFIQLAFELYEYTLFKILFDFVVEFDEGIFQNFQIL